MTQYSYAQLEALWIQNGGSAQTAPMAAAIAMAESGGNSNSHSGTDDWGLWQINKGGPAMLDPVANVRTAIQMSQNGMNWRPWCTAYADSACGTRGGAYLGAGAPFHKFLSGATPPAALTTELTGTGTSPSGSNATLTAFTAGQTGSDNDCLLKLPELGGGSLGPIPLPSLGGNCLFNRAQGRAVVGALSLAGGSLIMLVGVGFLLAGTRTGRQILQVVPNPVAQGAAQAGAQMQDTDRQELRQRRRDEERMRRVRGEERPFRPAQTQRTANRNTDEENTARARRNAARGGAPPARGKA